MGVSQVLLLCVFFFYILSISTILYTLIYTVKSLVPAHHYPWFTQFNLTLSCGVMSSTDSQMLRNRQANKQMINIFWFSVVQQLSVYYDFDITKISHSFELWSSMPSCSRAIWWTVISCSGVKRVMQTVNRLSLFHNFSGCLHAPCVMVLARPKVTLEFDGFCFSEIEGSLFLSCFFVCYLYLLALFFFYSGQGKPAVMSDYI